MSKNRFFRPRLTPLEARLVPSADILYVDGHIAAHSHSPMHDGTSWAKAFDTLQDALVQAATTSGPKQIWIAEGTYKPSQIYSPPDGGGHPLVGGAAHQLFPPLPLSNLKTFNLPDNVALYGGFEYGMPLSQRDPEDHPTILSGDLDGNDINDPANPGYAAGKADNAWHVVTAGNDVTQQGVTATLDGLQIVDGYANGPDVGGTLSPFVLGHSDGGGVSIAWGGHVTLNNDLFRYDHAGGDGGGVFANTSDVTATHCRFLNNSAVTRAGALEGLNDFENGISHTSNLADDYFQDNTCQVFGGAIVGEGAYQGAASAMTVRNATFVHNQAPEGGAIVIDTLTVRVDDCSFVNNVATVDAGALATTNVVGTIAGAPNTFATTVSDSAFIDNVCQADPAAHTALNNLVGAPGLNFAYGGGALVAYMNGYLNVDHDLFEGNVTRNGDGGAILNGNASANLFGISAFTVRTTVTDCLFRDNAAPHGNGGAIASESDHLSPRSTLDATNLAVSDSNLSDNTAGGNGGAIYLDSSVALITGNRFDDNEANQGDGVYGKTSRLNGLSSSNPQARAALVAANSLRDREVVLL
jgi:predicted outer membrane repeat protein